MAGTNYMRKLTPEQVEEAVRRLRSGETQRSLAAEYGVTPQAINKLWRKHRPQPSVKIQVLHDRDPDGACDFVVFIDDVRQDNVEVEDIDPGRGYSRSDWQDRIDGYAGDTTAFGRTAHRWLTEASHSQYVSDDS